MVRRNLTRAYRFLMWGGGLFAIVIGIALLLLVSLLAGEMIDTIYPYITGTTLLIIKTIGWIYIIPGIITFICGFWAGLLARANLNSSETAKPTTRRQTKIIHITVIITSIILLPAFPIGTFVGLTLLREAWMLKSESSLE